MTLSATRSGLFPLRRRAEEASAGLPALMAAAEKAATSIFTGDHYQRRVGAGEKFWQFREYAPGDRPQDIDWRQSAKGDRIFVRQKEWQTPQTALIWCQNSPGMGYHSRRSLPSKIQESVTLSLALSMMMMRAGEQVGLLDGSLRPGRAQGTLHMLGDHMLRTRTDDLPHPALQDIPRHAAAILIGDILSPSENISHTLDALAARAGSGLVIQVLDPAELSLPFSGRVIFENDSGAERHPIDDVASIGDAYRERMKSHIAHVRETCRRHNWCWILHSTDTDMRETLFEAWRLMGADEAGHGAGARSP